ncbi:MAG: hypothetical protein ACP5LJ_03365 [Candidatus Bipolaricaulaceae bacterium]
MFGEEKAKPNLQALALGYELAPNPVWELPPPQFQTGERMLISGGQAVGAGTIAAGCRFLAAYPMTPGTPVMEFLAPRAERFGIVVESIWPWVPPTAEPEPWSPPPEEGSPSWWRASPWRG